MLDGKIAKYFLFSPTACSPITWSDNGDVCDWQQPAGDYAVLARRLSHGLAGLAQKAEQPQLDEEGV
jgi:hypothetical protein